MAINFPDSPTNGQQVTVGSVTYEWNGTVWNRLADDIVVTSSDTAPTSPADGELWFDSSNLTLYIYYNDGTSSQWVETSGITGLPVIWVDDELGNVYYNGSSGVAIGSTTARAALDVNDTGAIVIPVGTDAQRPTPSTGMMRVNSDNGEILEVYGNGSWQQVINESRSQNVKNKTLIGPTKFETQTVNWTGATNLDPEDGLYLEVTLTGNTTLTDQFNDGENMTLAINDGTAFTITWPTITWFSNDGAAPTLQTTGQTLISVWKAGSTLYGFASNGA